MTEMPRTLISVLQKDGRVTHNVPVPLERPRDRTSTAYVELAAQ
jgi:hypothetical protein